jgi:hypothetical protein
MKGRITYLPSELIEQAERIKLEKHLKNNTEVWRAVSKYCRAGYETERILNYDFNLIKFLKGK